MNQSKTKTHTNFSILWYFLQGSKRFFFVSILAAVILTGMDMLTPKIISFTVDSVIGNEVVKLSPLSAALLDRIGDVETIRAALWIPALLVALTALFNAMGKYANIYFNTKGSENMMRHMRKSLFSHIQHLPYDWHMKNQTGDIIQRCTSDVDMVRNFISEQLTSVFRIVVLLIFTLYCMLKINVQLALIAVIAVPIIILYSTLFRIKIGKMFTECDESEGIFSTITQENLTGVRVVRAFGREDYERKRFEARNNKHTSLIMRLCKYLAFFWSSGDFIAGIQILLFIILGAVFCVRGDLTAGNYIALVSYNAMMIWPVRQLGRVISEMSKAGVSINRIKYIIDTPIEADAPDAVKAPMNGDICFSHVSYAYEEGKNVLDDVSFTVRGGSVFGILGSTGSGKSTLMYLLDRLCELQPNGGSITISGVDIRKIERTWLRSHIGIVLQEPFLFSRTLQENIGIAQEKPDMDAVRSAASSACLDETVMSFAKGYDTVVGERGVTLSGGQKQRAAIARMLLQNAPIMVFDDSLSAVDAQTDAQIRLRLRERFGDATVILISHRLTTLMQADQIIVLDRGKITESGTHEELIKKNGIYHQIYQLQISDSALAEEEV